MQEPEEGNRYRYESPKGSIVYAHHRPRDQESFMITFGYRIGGTVGDDLLKEITTVEATMAFYRSTSSN